MIMCVIYPFVFSFQFGALQNEDPILYSPYVSWDSRLSKLNFEIRRGEV